MERNMGSNIHCPSTYQDLRSAICLLALITDREPEVEPEPEQNVTETFREPEAGQDESDMPDDEAWKAFDESDRDAREHQKRVRSSLLDSLAHAIARFKSNRGGKSKDAKHVSSTMMILDEERETTRIICAKNEGLDHEDRLFLNAWKDRMETMSKNGVASESDKQDMFDLVYRHQQPRVRTYHSWLVQSFGSSAVGHRYEGTKHAGLTTSLVASLPECKIRDWKDDKGLRYRIHSSSQSDENSQAASDAAITSHSLKSESETVARLFEDVDSLCNSPGPLNPALAREIMHLSSTLWKGVRTQSALKARLHRKFDHDQKRKTLATKALLGLCRIYHCVCIFVKAAETQTILKSIELLLVPYQNNHLYDTVLSGISPLSVMSRLGLVPPSQSWKDFFIKQEPRFQRLMLENRSKKHVHAEIQALHHHDINTSVHGKGTVHPYIGCSRPCCWLCFCAIKLHGIFDVRGTHETIIHRWDFPMDMTTSSGNRAKLEYGFNRLLEFILKILQKLLTSAYPPRGRHMLAQSSAGLSSAQIETSRSGPLWERSARAIHQLMMMPTTFDGMPLVVKNPGDPNRVTLFGGPFTEPREVTNEDGEMQMSSIIRSGLGLEGHDPSEMPQMEDTPSRVCRLCSRPSSYHCAKCWTAYCGSRCQKKDWRKHLFVCCVPRRPNDVDHLRRVCGRLHLSASQRNSVLDSLYADDDLCRKFGFNQCRNKSEAINLFCIYNNLTRQCQSIALQQFLDHQQLGDLIEAWIHRSGQSFDHDSCPCFPWFLERREAGFCIPDVDERFQHHPSMSTPSDGTFDLQTTTLFELLHMSNSTTCPVRNLYCTLLRDYRNVPDPLDSSWIDFGFCFCRNESQKEALADAYLELLDTKTPLDQIAEAWETASLADLMRAMSVDITTLEANGIRLQRPHIDELGVFRLMAEVTHALSGHYCSCFTRGCLIRSDHETILSAESEGDYGFHGTNAWERWQLLNFYGYVFKHPDFDARAMLAARRDADSSALETYLESLVPDFRVKIWNKYLSDAMFPKLRAFVKFKSGRPRCWCVARSVVMPEGIDASCFHRIAALVKGRQEASVE